MQAPEHDHTGGATCPIRSKTCVCISGDHTFLQWITLTTDVYLQQGTPEPANMPHMISRRAQIYKDMNKAITNPTTCYSDGTLTAVAAAGIGEKLLGNAEQGSKHLIALRLLIQGRGGSRTLQDMLFGQALTVSFSLIFIGTGAATFPDKPRLNRAIGSFINTFQAMQRWNQSLRVDFEKLRDSHISSPRVDMSTDTSASLSETIHVVDVRDLQRYRSSRRKVFGKTSIFRKYIEPHSMSAISSERRYHFVILG